MGGQKKNLGNRGLATAHVGFDWLAPLGDWEWRLQSLVNGESAAANAT